MVSFKPETSVLLEVDISGKPSTSSFPLAEADFEPRKNDVIGSRASQTCTIATSKDNLINVQQAIAIDLTT